MLMRVRVRARGVRGEEWGEDECEAGYLQDERFDGGNVRLDPPVSAMVVRGAVSE